MLHSPGQAIEASARAFLEGRLGHDFSRVRVHTDPRAADAADAVRARAYTIGRSIVFARDQYAPRTTAGRAILAHELAHVVQQDRGASAPPARIEVSAPGDAGEREATAVAVAVMAGGRTGAAISARPPHLQRDAAAFFTSLFDLDFTAEELEAYLRDFADRGEIEGDYDSDDKAVQVVDEWKRGGSPHLLTMQRKAVLIREMLDGPTTADDEQAIVEILERSRSPEIDHMFGAGGVSASQILDDVPDDPASQLADFCRRRIVGGMARFRAGDVKAEGPAIPLAEPLPVPMQPLMPAPPLEDASPGWGPPCVLGILCSEDPDVVDQLRDLTVRRIGRIDVTQWSFDGQQWRSIIVGPTGLNRASEKLVGILRGDDCESAAKTLVHEVTHQTEDREALPTAFDRERTAYIFTEEWAIRRGLAARDPFRKVDPDSGTEEPDVEVIEEHVTRVYGRPDTGETGEAEQIIGHEAPKTTVLRIAGGGTRKRPSATGDRYLASPPTLVDAETLPPSTWRCPGP